MLIARVASSLATFGANGQQHGIKVIGSEGWIWVTRGVIEANDRADAPGVLEGVEQEALQGRCHRHLPHRLGRRGSRAVLEGTAFAMRDVVDRLSALGVPTTTLRLMGGGARSQLWCRIRADVAGRPLDLVQIPLAAMDVTFSESHYLGLSAAASWEQIVRLLDWAADVYPGQLAIIHGMWSTPADGTFRHDGDVWPVADSPALPKPVQAGGPPIIIGGTGTPYNFSNIDLSLTGPPPSRPFR